MIKVYHQNRLRYPQNDVRAGSEAVPATQLGWPDGYHLAAEVQIPAQERDALQYAWAITQNVDEEWVDNPGVQCCTDKPRSTAVGDVLKDETGRLWVVASTGFRPVATGQPGRQRLRLRLFFSALGDDAARAWEMAERLECIAPDLLTANALGWPDLYRLVADLSPNEYEMGDILFRLSDSNWAETMPGVTAYPGAHNRGVQAGDIVFDDAQDTLYIITTDGPKPIHIDLDDAGQPLTVLPDTFRISTLNISTREQGGQTVALLRLVGQDADGTGFSFRYEAAAPSRSEAIQRAVARTQVAWLAFQVTKTVPGLAGAEYILPEKQK